MASDFFFDKRMRSFPSRVTHQPILSITYTNVRTRFSERETRVFTINLKEIFLLIIHYLLFQLKKKIRDTCSRERKFFWREASLCEYMYIYIRELCYGAWHLVHDNLRNVKISFHSTTTDHGKLTGSRTFFHFHYYYFNTLLFREKLNRRAVYWNSAETAPRWHRNDKLLREGRTFVAARSNAGHVGGRK